MFKLMKNLTTWPVPSNYNLDISTDGEEDENEQKRFLRKQIENYDDCIKEGCNFFTYQSC